MTDESITIKQMLEDMGKGRPFSLTYVTADTTKGTGGKLVKIASAILSGYNLADGTRVTASVMNKAGLTGKSSKKPNHSAHFTRNILLKDSTLRKVHIDLVTEYNGKKVL